MRKFAISDIHGAKKTLVALLDKLQFSTKDELYLLGDYIDRGPDSKGVIDYIWQLQNEGYTLKCLRGNHEQMLINICDSPLPYHKSNYPYMLKSFGISDPNQTPVEYLNWMKSLPWQFEVDQYILVHAGLNYNVDNPLMDTDAMLWIRDSRGMIDRQWLNGRIVIHGHTPTAKDAIEHYAKHLNSTPQLVIDNGCVFGHRPGLGHLAALELGTHELTFMACVD
ncbi:MAG: metallophosphoesterase family protein [Bacteroidota bacterium]